MFSSLMSVTTKQKITTAFTSVGLVLTIIEITSYAILFHHIGKQNNNVAAFVLSPKVIQQRNKANAISFVGQFAGWIMEVWYVVLVGLLAVILKMDSSVREVSSMVKDFEFALIPMVEVFTSSPIQNFRAQRFNKI